MFCCILFKYKCRSTVKNPPPSAGDAGSTPGWQRPPGEGNGNPLQYSCLKNPIDRGVWWATVHGSQRVGQNYSSKKTCTTMSIAALFTIAKILDPNICWITEKARELQKTSTSALLTTPKPLIVDHNKLENS